MAILESKFIKSMKKHNIDIIVDSNDSRVYNVFYHNKNNEAMQKRIEGFNNVRKFCTDLLNEQVT